MSQKWIKVKLTPKEVDDCIRAGTHRFESNRNLNKPPSLRCKHTKPNDAVRDIEGIKGELAVANAFNSEYSVFEYGVDNGIDLWIGDLSVDVKVTTHLPQGKKEPHLLFPKSGKGLRADIAILTILYQDNEILIAGWLTKRLWDERKADFWYDPRDDAAPLSDLLPMYELWIEQINRRFKR